MRHAHESTLKPARVGKFKFIERKWINILLSSVGILAGARAVFGDLGERPNESVIWKAVRPCGAPVPRAPCAVPRARFRKKAPLHRPRLV